MPDSDSAEFSHPRYSVVRKLAHGRLTKLFEAVDVHPRLHNRRTALKVLCRNEYLRWFLRIGRATAYFSHPGIVGCYEVGEYQAATYIALEFVQGPSLRDEISRGTSWSVMDALNVVREVGAALDHAHSHGIVHGHLHPKHILLTADRQRRLIGFGEYPLPADCPFGSPIHLAPEQLVDVAQATPQSDVYALSETAFWTLAGRHPYEAANGSITKLMAAKSAGTCQSLSQIRGDLPIAVDEVLKRGMAPEPEKRFQSAGDFAESLAASLVGKSS